MLLNDIVEDRKTGHEFLESEEFKNLFEKIKAYDSLDQEEIKYEQVVIEGVSPDDFTRVCETIYDCYEDSLRVFHGSSFPQYFIDYNGVRVSLMIGQGSNYHTQRITED